MAQNSNEKLNKSRLYDNLDNTKFYKEYLTILKIIILGESGVGKTSLIKRYVNNTFSKEYVVTVGIECYTKIFNLDVGNVKTNIWDTAGQERFRSENILTSNFYRHAQGAIFVYDLTMRESFEKLNFWFDELKKNVDQHYFNMILVGNKIDEKDRKVSRQEGSIWAKEHNALFIEASAKTNEHVDWIFEHLVEDIIKTPNLWEVRYPSSSNIRLDQSSQQMISNNAPCCASKLWNKSDTEELHKTKL